MSPKLAALLDRILDPRMDLLDYAEYLAGTLEGLVADDEPDLMLIAVAAGQLSETLAGLRAHIDRDA
jgi:hypothetical protein